MRYFRVLYTHDAEDWFRRSMKPGEKLTVNGQDLMDRFGSCEAHDEIPSWFADTGTVLLYEEVDYQTYEDEIVDMETPISEEEAEIIKAFCAEVGRRNSAPYN